MASSHPSPASNKPAPEPTAHLIERLCRAFLATLNDRDFDFSRPEAQEVLSHIAPDWRAKLPTFVPGARFLSLEEQMVIWRRRALEHPDVQYGIDCIFSDVRERDGVASVFVSMWISGIADARLNNMNECTWRWRCGKWMWIGMQGIRANPISSGGLG